MSMHPMRNYFKEYKGAHNTFIETGSYRGDGIYLAMQAGYARILSMDIDGANVAHCQERFELIPDDKRPANNDHINIICGDSATGLFKFMKYVNEPAMIWLDAHSQLFDDEPPVENPFPLMKELEQLRRHPIKTHTILIDDILILTHPDVTRWNKDAIENALLTINPAYKLTYLSNPIVNNILMAYV
jgi:hypothetical protein